ncbi:hypothetical protein [Curtobacterium sp. SORGH_AS_0776]|uniref:hypothetical protein n=1 Tax=Curtobacterium sp. SORGH_AS_0776 TaxID=3041798 RepID=UPI00285CD02E|nr:hypothetical protein [Curtobacterium sp. SORGH_AS_0776]MDR6172633.1 hypothetical protein [Curtobacterium sp. SORGH_AS_0776]
MTTPTSEQYLVQDLRTKASNIRADATEAEQDWIEVAESLEVAADRLEAVRQEVLDYAGWYEYSPEDSWRFERDLRTALGMKQYTGDDE